MKIFIVEFGCGEYYDDASTPELQPRYQLSKPILNNITYE